MTSSCASCGATEGNDNNIKLRKCSACHRVSFCGLKCQKEHWPKHKRACKKHVAEQLFDDILFKQPEGTHQGDCPICFLPLSIDENQSSIATCCSKIICNGCDRESNARDMQEGLDMRCAFCRKPCPDSLKESKERLRLKAEKMNDPVAMRQYGLERSMEGDFQTALKHWLKAAELGDAGAHLELALLYQEGQAGHEYGAKSIDRSSMIEKDVSKSLHHYEQAAIGGHPSARNNLACIEWASGRRERAIKHWVIAAKLGHTKSLECVKTFYKDGFVSKDDFAAALRGHQAAVDATKSRSREVAEQMRLMGFN